MPSAKSGTAGTADAPVAPGSVTEADDGSPGDLSDFSQTADTTDADSLGTSNVSSNREDSDSPAPSQPPAQQQSQTTPTPTITAKWSKEKVTPDHNSSYPPSSAPTDTVPDEAKASALVDTTNVPDGTAATISIQHCQSGADVTDGYLDNLEVRGNKVVDKKTGQPPVWVFRQDQLPWDPYDAPYFFFSVTVDFQSLSAQTPTDFQSKKSQCLRVLYWHQQIAETSTLAGVLPECNTVQGILNNSGKDSKSAVQQISGTSVSLKNIGSLLRNTYSCHVGSHGAIKSVSDDSSSSMYLDSSVQPPDFDDHTSTVPANDKGQLPGSTSDWKSVVCFGQHSPASITVAKTYGPQKGSNFVNKRDFFGADETGVEDDFPSVPRYLFYSSTCLTGWESGFADQLISRGCRNVIAFRRTIPDAEAPAMAEAFYKMWMNTYNLNPDKIPDCFIKAASDHYDNMRPVLYGEGATEIGPQKSLLTKAMDAIASVVGAVAALF